MAAGVICPCGCGKPARTAQGWAARGCALRAIPKELRAARGRAWAKAHPDQCRTNGAKGGWKNRRSRWDDLLDKWLDDDMVPAVALRQSYARGYHAGYLARQRKQAAKEAA